MPIDTLRRAGALRGRETGLLAARLIRRRGAGPPNATSAVAINWAMSKGAVVIVGMKTPEQVRENLGALGWRISGAESDELERAARLAKTATQNIFQTD